MSLHDVVIELLYGGFPKSETDRDRLLAAVREDQLAQLYRDAPKIVPNPDPVEAVPPSVYSDPAGATTSAVGVNTLEQTVPRYDPNTGERLQ